MTLLTPDQAGHEIANVLLPAQLALKDVAENLDVGILPMDVEPCRRRLETVRSAFERLWVVSKGLQGQLGLLEHPRVLKALFADVNGAFGLNALQCRVCSNCSTAPRAVENFRRGGSSHELDCPLRALPNDPLTEATKRHVEKTR